MYELIVLSLLMRFPLHGYLIAQIANDVIGPWAKLSNGTLYPLLTKLAQREVITHASDDDPDLAERQGRTFVITPTGRARFLHLMVDTTSNIGDYQRIFHLKVPYLDLVGPRERLHILNHYLGYCQMCVLHNTTHTHNLTHELGQTAAAPPLYYTLAVQVMDERSRLWQAEIDWVLQLRTLLVPVTDHGAALG
jgi:DNA-binding PadR family transcriptional regulator